MKTPLGRDDFFKIEYVSVSCPDHGDIRLLPYVSAGAMEAYMSADDNPERAFELLYRASVAEDSPAITALTKDDVEVVARFYMESLDCKGD